MYILRVGKRRAIISATHFCPLGEADMVGPVLYLWNGDAYWHLWLHVNTVQHNQPVEKCNK